MAIKHKANLKILYPMGEICEMFDLPASTIRFWEKNFSQIKPKKNAKGNRMFTTEDVEVLKVIYHLVKEKGMTLSGADKFMKDNRTAARKETGMVEILMRIRATLVDIRTEINTLEKRQQNEIVIQTQDNESQAEQQADQEHDEPSKPRYIELTLFDI